MAFTQSCHDLCLRTCNSVKWGDGVRDQRSQPHFLEQLSIICLQLSPCPSDPSCWLTPYLCFASDNQQRLLPELQTWVLCPPLVGTEWWTLQPPSASHNPYPTHYPSSHDYPTTLPSWLVTTPLSPTNPLPLTPQPDIEPPLLPLHPFQENKAERTILYCLHKSTQWTLNEQKGKIQLLIFSISKYGCCILIVFSYQSSE